MKSEWTLHQGNEANDSYCRTAYFGTRTQAPTNSSTSADPSTPAADDSSPRSEVSDGAAPAVPRGPPSTPVSELQTDPTVYATHMLTVDNQTTCSAQAAMASRVTLTTQCDRPEEPPAE